MFCKKTFYSKIEKNHCRDLKVIYVIDDSYKNLLLWSNSVSIHQRHLQFLVIFKSISQINPEFMWSFFKQKKLSCNLRKGPILNTWRTQFTYCGTNAIHFKGSLVWNNFPAKVKSSNSVYKFKTKINKTYLQKPYCVVIENISAGIYPSTFNNFHFVEEDWVL